MNQIILASHGGMSSGVLDTASMILGDLPNVYAIATTRDETEPVSEAAKRLLSGFSEEDAVYILTDVLGGSVNNAMLELVPEYPNVTLICGMNICLVLNLASEDEPLSKEALDDIIKQAKDQIINCSEMLHNAKDMEEDDL